MDNPEERGVLSNYRYAKVSVRDGVRIIFLDCRKFLTTFRAFLFSSVAVSLCGFCAVLISVVVLSKRVIRPFVESQEKQKRFITDAGHELKTPLTIIEADRSILELEYGENEWLTDIQLQTQRLTGLTNDLIYLSRMEEGTVRERFIEFPLSDVLEETAGSFQNLARTQGKHFKQEIEPMLHFLGDEKAIRQMISVLLENALKYSDEGGNISLKAEKRGRNIIIRVFNTAESVETENLSLLFDRFYRSDVSRNSKTGGYGIGLSIAKAVVQAHKGKISVSSEDGRSFTVVVVLQERGRG